MTWLTAHLEIVFGGTLALFAVLLLVQQRRSPQSTAAWLLFVFLLPYLALPMFLAFGVRKPYRASHLNFSEPDRIEPPAAAMDIFFRELGMPGARSGNRIEIFEDGATAFAGLNRLITGAEHTIDAEFYIVENDEIGRAFVELLTRRAREGIRVRLMIDRFGGLSRPRQALERLREAGGEVLFSSPFLGLPGRGRLNLRNHRKTLVADGCRVFAGGMNVGRAYMSADAAAPALWTDLSFALEAPALRSNSNILTSDLDDAHRRAAPEAGEIPPSEIRCAAVREGNAVLQPIPSGPDISGDTLHDGLVAAIHRAERRVWIVTPYYLPTDQLAHALNIATLRGLDVRLLVPAKSNQTLADLARGIYIRGLADAGGRVFLTRDRRMIHAKAGIIDDFAWLGSANFDVRSMYLNFEAALFAYDAGTVAHLERWFEDQCALCSEGPPQASLPRRIAEGAFRLAAPVL